mmetsp:Transcript_5667/g.15914  ORF Transcript_5667/g.15914 Transcript_5667/m.15914 type:complete len:367 (-) Transcript_5667:81-1181(-)|eukprot:CAMPEP_0181027864 /NCGR_PEP_ID=MMETSP1070-20121207/4379_1 /TAXON_ID=265543 /ORGANISM="Minutocellus polymorphus, Strain NH13" /LENGTH=366 /DNA_ID=CAMNT_0023105109 /DNA_START=329 /DNA_END=1429 /DNA_ORIENTATION=+
MESFFANFSHASPVTGADPSTTAAADDPPPAYPRDDPLSVLDSIRRAKAVAAATNAECDPAPPSPARSARSARSSGSNLENGCVEVDINAGPIAYNGGGVAEFLSAREDAENGGRKKKKKWGLFGSPRSTKTGRTNILDDDGDIIPPPPPDEDDAKAGSKRRRVCIAAALLLALIGVAVALGVVFGGKNNSSSSTSSAVAGGSDVPDDFDNAGIPDDFDNVSPGTADEFGNQEDIIDNIMMGEVEEQENVGNTASVPVPAPPTLRPPSAAPPTPRPPPTPCASNTYDAGFGCLGRCEAGQKCGEYGFFDAFYPNDDRPCPSMCCRNGRIELGAQDVWYQCCEGVASNLADYQRPGSNVRRSCSPLF